MISNGVFLCISSYVCRRRWFFARKRKRKVIISDPRSLGTYSDVFTTIRMYTRTCSFIRIHTRTGVHSTIYISMQTCTWYEAKESSFVREKHDAVILDCETILKRGANPVREQTTERRGMEFDEWKTHRRKERIPKKTGKTNNNEGKWNNIKSNVETPKTILSVSFCFSLRHSTSAGLNGGELLRSWWGG